MAYVIAGSTKGYEILTDPATKQTYIAGLVQLPLVAAPDFARALVRCDKAMKAGGSGASAVITLHVTNGPAAAVQAAASLLSGGLHPTGAARWAAQGQSRRIAAPYAAGGKVGATERSATSLRHGSLTGEGWGASVGPAADGAGDGLQVSKLTFVEVAAQPADSERASTAGRMGLAALYGRLAGNGNNSGREQRPSDQSNVWRRT